MVEEYTKYLFLLENKDKLLHCTARKLFIFDFAIAVKFRQCLDVAEDLFVENQSFIYCMYYYISFLGFMQNYCIFF